MRILLIVLLVTPLVAKENGRHSGIAEPPSELSSYEKRGAPLPSDDVFEVVASKLDTVTALYLYSASFAAITEADAKNYTGGHYICPKGRRPYLVRALYLSGGTGGFEVYKWDSAIWVFHGCLGGAASPHESALIVNLDSPPTKLYVSAVVSDL